MLGTLCVKVHIRDGRGSLTNPETPSHQSLPPWSRGVIRGEKY
jgi:hypothetical protein